MEKERMWRRGVLRGGVHCVDVVLSGALHRWTHVCVVG
jgi:hypothetical protein